MKFHWKPLLGVHSLVWDEAQKIAGKDPDFNRRDLWEAIEAGDFPEWELGVQLVAGGGRARLRLRPARRDQAHPRGAGAGAARRPDDAQPQPGQLLRRDRAGRLPHRQRRAGHRLHQRPAAAGPAFSYLDTQLIRLGGPNFAQIPINRPVAPVHNQPARRLPPARDPHRPGELLTRTPSAAAARPSPAPTRRRLPALHRSGSTATRSASAQRELQGPLQPGARCSGTA